MNSCRGRSEIMSFHGFFILMGGLILHGAKDEGSFEAHAPCLKDAFDRAIKVIQLAKAKLGSKALARGKRTQRRILLKNMSHGGHTWRDRSPSSSHKNLNAMKMLPGGDMVQRIVMEKVRGDTTSVGEENKIDASPAIRWRRPCMRVAICLSIDQEKLLREHGDVEAGDRKGRGSDNESRGAHLPKSKALVINEDSGECHNAVKADLPIAKKGTQMQGNG
ncbi:hypothetical protein GW17_00040381 [Ensete ventricosum]|nr:hypothetical protein GW17_00040381 [Ensete ventricosum]